jgi:hypothetical protein
MNRRELFKTVTLAGLAAPLTVKKSAAHVVAHNWDKYDFGSGPPVNDRLNQGPFPEYAPEDLYPGGDVVMTTTPTEEAVPNYGRGMITYIAADSGTSEIVGDDKPKAIEELVRVPLGQKLYIRPTWREVQQQRGRLNFPEYWKLTLDLAREHNKRVAFRIQMRAPDYKEEALPDFVLEKVPMVKLEGGTWRRNGQTTFSEPRYDHPAFQEAFQELNALLAAELNGNPQIEFIDTFMYGFWGEGHTWPFKSNPFPDYATAERTWMRMMETQLEHWTKTPLATNTQPDYSQVGDSEMLDRTIRTNNWIRSDSIYIENMQIESLSNRPPWTAAVLEVGMHAGPPGAAPASRDGVSVAENRIGHVLDVGANYMSLWNFHRISAASIMEDYHQNQKIYDEANRRLGYNVRPSFIWTYEGGNPGLIIGFANDGVAGVPGVLHISVVGEDDKVLAEGGLDPGYPLPGKIRQAQFPLVKGTKWEGLKLRAELDVKGVRYPVHWACRQPTNPDGSLTLRRNLGRG